MTRPSTFLCNNIFLKSEVSVYCLCSNASFDEIFDRQRNAPLPCKEMIERHTGCAKGCGSCIDALLAEAEMLELIPEAVEVCVT
jgi:bacterioferritin-associated ferredoxin